MRSIVRWVGDWRNGATIAASLLLVALLLVVTDAVAGRRQAFEALQRQTEQLAASRAAASRRIDLLQAKIDELIGRGEVNAAELGRLVAEVAALRAQVKALGGEPVVEERTVATPTTRPPAASPAIPFTTTTSSTSTTSPPATSTSTTTSTAPPRPSPLVCSIAAIPLVCTQGAP